MTKFNIGDKVKCNHYDVTWFIVTIFEDEVIIELNTDKDVYTVWRSRWVDKNVPEDYISIANDKYWYCPTDTMEIIK
jgi:hypothetical protein